MHAGLMAMQATATGTGAGIEVSDSDPVFFYAKQPPMPSIDIEKYVNGQEADTPFAVTVRVGDSVTFDYEVTNTGNTVLDHVNVVDSVLGPRECPKTTLQPGETMWCTPFTKITDKVENVVMYATATGVSPEGTMVSDRDAGKFRVVA
jgi:hypothetical protein